MSKRASRKAIAKRDARIRSYDEWYGRPGNLEQSSRKKPGSQNRGK